MPNPFPGMNPYLEDPLSWGDMHTSLLTYIREALQPQLGPDYVARLEESVEIEESDHRWKPDVFIAAENGSNGSHDVVTAGSVATIARPVIFDVEEELTARWIEIFDVRNREVVTVIEVLSPSNKSASGYGEQKYTRKIQEFWRTPVNVVEIDLLRAGLPVTAAEIDLYPRRLPSHDYLISVSRGSQRSRYEVYPFALRDLLPPIGIPLRPGDTDVILELTSQLGRVYDMGAYDRVINYDQAPPLPPLNERDAAWVDELLREKKLRRASQAVGE